MSDKERWRRNSKVSTNLKDECGTFAEKYLKRVGDAYLKELEDDEIILFGSTRQRRIPGTHFECRVCNYQIRTAEKMEDHRQTYSHQRKKKIAKENQQLKQIGKPTDAQEKVLSSYLEHLYNDIALPEQETETRKQVVRQLEQHMRAHSQVLSLITLQITGSVNAGFALRDSDTNIRVVAPKDSNFGEIFREIHQTLINNDSTYKEVNKDFTSRNPSIQFKKVDVMGTFCIRKTELGSHRTSIILSRYSTWSHRLQQLALLFKYWAKKRQLSDVAKGGLLPQCFPILVIYCCQKFGLAPFFKLTNEDEIDEKEPQYGIEEIECPDDEISGRSLGSLWIDMLRFYSLQFSIGEDSANIVEDQSQRSKPKRIVILDPGVPKRDLCLGVSSFRILDFLYDEIRSCFKFFACKEHSFNTYMEKCQPGLPIYCHECHEPGHMAENCPVVDLPLIDDLPTISNAHRDIVNNLLNDIKEQNELNQRDMETRQCILQDLKESISSKFPGASLELFGSSANGFGSCSSDMDVCMTLQGKSSLEKEEIVDNIKQIEMILHKNASFDNITPILTAQVPIVKFHDKERDIDGDVSLYNRLALQNTRMLHRYSQIDERLRTLGFCVKEFAKECQMANAAERTLSSYAYTLMMIYYLQRCDPPVLPILQEIDDGTDEPRPSIDECDVWFYDKNNEALKRHWPGFGQNKDDVAVLWIGFLDFYAQRFDYKTMVVSIRRSADLTKFDKFWNSDKLAIEDPFNLTHNLGAGLSSKTNAQILTNFIVARRVFGTPITSQPEGSRTKYSYFFQHEDLVRKTQ